MTKQHLENSVFDTKGREEAKNNEEKMFKRIKLRCPSLLRGSSCPILDGCKSDNIGCS